MNSNEGVQKIPAPPKPQLRPPSRATRSLELRNLARTLRPPRPIFGKKDSPATESAHERNKGPKHRKAGSGP